ncbi:MAG: ribosome silencing factor [Rhodobacteraceae bacterium]|nr:ribosome silencing factor [Paracoccaceae bacterium]
MEGSVLAGPTFAVSDAGGCGVPRTPAPRPLSSEDLLGHIIASLSEDKAEDVVQIDLRGKSSMADYMVIASGRSARQVTAVSEHLADRLKTLTGHRHKMEGMAAGDWVLIDAGDVIIHVFRPEVREFYQLEKLWMPTDAATGVR